LIVKLFTICSNFLIDIVDRICDGVPLVIHAAKAPETSIEQPSCLFSSPRNHDRETSLMSTRDSASQPSIRLHDESCSHDAGAGPRPSVGGKHQLARQCHQEHELDRITGVAAAKTVCLKVGQVVPLLMHAMETNRTWLKDFAEDTVRIDADLYEVLLAYQQIIDRQAA